MAFNIKNYIANASKSIAYISLDVVKELNPAINDLASSQNIDFSKELLSNVKNFKKNMRNKASSAKNDEYTKIATEFVQNTIEDFKSGNWYNKERQNKNELAMFGFDMEDDWNFDFDEPSDIASSISDNSNDKLASTFDSVGEKIANASSNATLKSAQFIASSNNANTKSMISAASVFTGQINTGLAAINNTIASFASSVVDPLNSHIKNSTEFYKNTTTLLQDQNRMLAETVTVLKNRYEPNKRNNSYKTKKDYSYVTNGDIIDISNYFDTVKSNIKEMTSLYTDMIKMMDMGSEKGSGLKMFTGSPISMMIGSIAKSVTENVMGDSLDRFNKTLQGFFGSLIMKINSKRNDMGFTGLLSRIFGIKSERKTEIDTSKYEKGRVDFDGITRKSIIEVIPTQLAKIVSLLSGDPEQRFDYKTGKFVTVRSIKRKEQINNKKYSNYASSDIRSSFSSYLSNVKFDSRKEKEAFYEDMEKFFEYLYSNASMYNYKEFNSSNSDKLANKYGKIDPRSLKLITEFYRANEKNKKGHYNLSLAGEIFRERANQTRSTLNEQEAGDSIYTHLYNNSYNDNNKGKRKIQLGLLGVEDDKGNNIFFYLQNFYKSLKNIERNGGLGNGKYRSKLSDIEVPNNKTKTTYEIEQEAKDKTADEYFELSRQRAIRNGAVSFDKLTRMPSGTVQDFIKSAPSFKEREDQIKKDYNDIYTSLTRQGYDKEEAAEYAEQIVGWAPKKNKFSESFRNANTISGKINAIKDYTTEKLLSPSKFVSNLLDNIDTRMYEMIYGKDETGNKESMLGHLLDKIDDGMDEFFNDLKNKTQKFFNETLGLNKVWDKLLGGKNPLTGKREGGSLSPFINQVKGNLKSAGGFIKRSISRTGEALLSPFDLTTSGVGGVAYVGNAYNGGIVKRTGVAALSEGEMIIPSEYNPYYNGTNDKAVQKARENIAKSRYFRNKKSDEYWGEFAFGTKSAGPNRKENGFTDEDLNNMYKSFINAGFNGEEAKRQTAENAGIHEDRLKKLKSVKDFIYETAHEASRIILEGAKATRDRLFGDGTEKESKVEKGAFNDAINDIFKKRKYYAPIAATGALIGGGLSLVTGMVGGPLLGAATGAATSLIIKSDKLQDILFGKVDENGDRAGGVLNKKITDFITKTVPSIGHFGITGAIASLIPGIPGGPIAGLLVGSALGAAWKSNNFQNWLFGDGTENNKGKLDKNKIMKLFPNIAAGAALGAAFGPFGIVGNIMVGAALGYSSTTEKFKTMIFGGKDADGEMHGGVLGYIKDDIIDPLKNYIKDNTKSAFDYIKENVVDNIRDLLKPMGTVLKKAIGGFGNILKTQFKASVMVPIQQYIRSLLIKPLAKMIGGTFKKLIRPAAFVATAPFRIAGAVGRGLQKRQIKSGDAADYMSLDERIEFRRKNNMENSSNPYYNLDNMLLDMSGEDLDQMRSQMKNTRKEFKSVGLKYTEASNEFTNKMEVVNMPIIQRRKITKLLNNGKYDEASKIISGLNISDNNKQMLLNQVSKFKNDISTSASISDRLNNDNRAFYDKLKAQGININDKNFNKIYAAVNNRSKELKNNKVSIQNMQPEERSAHELITISEIIHNIDKNLETILNRGTNDSNLKENSDGIINQNGKYVDTSNSINNESGKKKIIDANGRILSITRDEKSGDQKLDTTDSGTVEALRQEKEEIEDRRSIRDSLASFTSRLENFISGVEEPDEKKKPSWISSIWDKLKGVGSFAVGAIASAIGPIISTVLPYVVAAIGGKFILDGGIGKIKSGLDNIEDTLRFRNDNDKENYELTYVTDKAFPGIARNFLKGQNYSKLLARNTPTSLLGKIKQVPSKGVKTLLRGAESARDFVFKNSSSAFKNVSTFNTTYKSLIKSGMSSEEALKYTTEIIGMNPKTSSTILKGSKLFDNAVQLSKIPIEKAKSYISNSVLASELKIAGQPVEAFINKGLNTGKSKVSEGAAKLSKYIGKGKVAVSSIAEKSVEKLTTTLKSKIGSLLGKISKYLPDGMTEVIKDKFIPQLSSEITKRAGSSKIAGFAKQLTQIGPLDLAIAVADAINGFTDARSILGIVDKPTFFQKAMAAVVSGIYSLIPFIGGLFPTEWLMSLLIWVLDLIPIFDMSGIKKQRAEAKKIVDEYNRENNTHLTVREYCKNVLNDKSLYDRASGVVKKVWSGAKSVGKTIIGGPKAWVEGVKSVGKSAWSGIKSAGNAVAKFFGGGSDDEKETKSKSKKTMPSSEYTKYEAKSTGSGSTSNNESSFDISSYYDSMFSKYKIASPTSYGSIYGTGSGIMSASRYLSGGASGAQVISSGMQTIPKNIQQLQATKAIVDVNTTYTKRITEAMDVATQSLAGSDARSISNYSNKILSFIDEKKSMASFDRDTDIPYSKSSSFSDTLKRMIKSILQPVIILSKTMNAASGALGVALDEEEGSGSIAEANGVTSVKKLSGFEKLKNTLSKVGSTLKNFLTGGGSFVSQRDPRYAGMKFGNSTIGDNGCAPAAAAMVVNETTGKDLSLYDAAQYAKNKGYVAGGSQGTRSGYFEDIFSNYGLPTNYTDNTSDINNSISSGKPTVLLGQDHTNRSKAKSPFGPNPHYVVANGFDKSGNVIINDPELGQPVKYSKNILSNAKLGVSVGGRSGLNKFRNMIAGASMLKTANEIISANEGAYDAINPNDNGALSIGTIQWHAGRAKGLIKRIIEANPSQAQSILGDTLYNSALSTTETWNTKKLTKGSDEYNRIKSLLQTQESITVQEALRNEDIAKEINDGRKRGLIDSKSLIYYADFANQYGKDSNRNGMLNAAAQTAGSIGNVSLNDIHGAAAGWSNGAYKTRRKATYDKLNSITEELTDDVNSAAASFSNNAADSTSNISSDSNPTTNAKKKKFEVKEFISNPISSLASIVQSNIEERKSKSSSFGSIDNMSNLYDTFFESVARSYSQKSKSGSKILSIFGFNDKDDEDENTTSGLVDSNISTSSESSTGKSFNLKNASDTERKILNAMFSIEGKNKYSMEDRERVDASLKGLSQGSADCSSTYRWAIKSTTGIDPGSYTLAQYTSSNGRDVDRNVDGTGPNESNLRPGDALFYYRDGKYTSGRKDRVGHVEMYIGDGQRIGHGGPGVGPNRSPITTDAARYLGARRYIPDESNTSVNNSTATGSGLLSSYELIGAGSGISSNRLSRTQSIAVSKVNSGLRSRVGSGASTLEITEYVKSAISLLQNIANNTSKIDSIVNLLVKYFNSKLNAYNSNENGESATVIVDNTKNTDLSQESDLRELLSMLEAIAIG